jgi:exo-poly-alpha-galacturonosidase
MFTVCGQQNVAANFGTGSNVPQQLCVPTLSFNQSTIWLVWNKPDNHSAIRDYNVYMNGKKLCSASKNAVKYSSAAPYIANFYAHDAATKFHVPITFHSFLVTNLSPNSTYNFTVRSVDLAGTESADSATLVATTAPEYSKVVDVTQFGAIGDNSTMNTAAIQQAINNCSNGSKSAFGCKVVIPKGIFVTGPIILKSNMTLEVAEGATLKATTNSSDFTASDGTILSLIATNVSGQ